MNSRQRNSGGGVRALLPLLLVLFLCDAASAATIRLELTADLALNPFARPGTVSRFTRVPVVGSAPVSLEPGDQVVGRLTFANNGRITVLDDEVEEIQFFALVAGNDSGTLGSSSMSLLGVEGDYRGSGRFVISRMGGCCLIVQNSNGFVREDLTASAFSFSGLEFSFQLDAGRGPYSIGNFSTTRAIVAFDGATQSQPVLPTRVTGSVFEFEEARSGYWFDPPGAGGFEFRTTDGSLFVAIEDLPVGFDAPFLVEVDGVVLGTFAPGQRVRFAGDGVSAFSIRGISPLVDGLDPRAFPVRLSFDRDRVDFTMRAIGSPTHNVPAPSGVAFALLLLVVLAAGRRGRAMEAGRVR